ncbi:MAG TPA: hypothetical protein VFB36_02585 [Nevskiaceae bacterium]|nr:hypothetical protein [Nevskiaceae bacterium]
MRNFLMFLGSLLLMLVVIGGLGLVYATIKGPELDRDSRAFVDASVQTICADWNEQALVERAAPELIQSVGQGVLERMFGRFRQLGGLQGYSGADGDASMTLTSKGLSVTALYFARATFAAGDAVIRVALTRQHGDWKIIGFKVDSEAIAAKPYLAKALDAPAAATGRDADVEAYGTGSEGFDRWCRASLSAISTRYQSATEVWIAMSDTYGPYPNRALAARAASKYLAFDPTVPFMKVVLFRSNQRIADATVNRE